jgi:hypothetical protein
VYAISDRFLQTSAGEKKKRADPQKFPDGISKKVGSKA